MGILNDLLYTPKTEWIIMTMEYNEGVLTPMGVRKDKVKEKEKAKDESNELEKEEDNIKEIGKEYLKIQDKNYKREKELIELRKVLPKNTNLNLSEINELLDKYGAHYSIEALKEIENIEKLRGFEILERVPKILETIHDLPF